MIQTELEAVKGELAAAISAKDEAVGALAKAKADADAAVAEAQKQVADLTAAKAAVDGELVQAKAKLANPAFAHAAAKGQESATPEGGAASEEGSLWAKYNAMTDGKERTRFYRANKEAMDAEAGR